MAPARYLIPNAGSAPKVSRSDPALPWLASPVARI